MRRRRVVELRLRSFVPAEGSWHASPAADADVTETGDRARPRAAIEPASDPWDELPASVQHLRQPWDELQALVDTHLSADSFLEHNPADYWIDEASRLRVLEGLNELEGKLAAVLGPHYEVHVSREPAVSEIQMMGEYGCDWPLWGRGIATDREDWPQISDRLADKLRAWALQADPDAWGRPRHEDTERILRDLRSELGSRFAVTATVD